MSGHQNLARREPNGPRLSSVWWRVCWRWWCGTAGAENDFGHCMGSRVNERGTKLWDLRGSGIFHFAGYWTDEGPSGENDRWVSVGNLTRTVDDALGAQLRRIRAYGGRTSWNLGLNYLSCIQDMAGSWLEDDSLRANCCDEHSVHGNFTLDKLNHCDRRAILYIISNIIKRLIRLLYWSSRGKKIRVARKYIKIILN